MQTMKINKQPFYYATYMGKQVTVDEYGNETGEYKLFYNPPILSEANISAGKGEVEIKAFGESLDYDKVIVMGKRAGMMIQESTRLWIDTLPAVDEHGEIITNDDGEVETPHDYIVKKIATGINMKQIAIRKVEVSGENA